MKFIIQKKVLNRRKMENNETKKLYETIVKFNKPKLDTRII